jgi:hypothetical protein
MSSSTGDDALLAELGEAIRENVGPVPDELVTAGKGIYAWRTIDGELAALTFDSLLDESVGAVRSHIEAPRVLTFEAGSTVVDAELSVVAGVRRLMGNVSPARTADLELTTDNDRLTAPVDGRGRFSLDLPDATSRIELQIHFDDGTSIRTAATAV